MADLTTILKKNPDGVTYAEAPGTIIDLINPLVPKATTEGAILGFISNILIVRLLTK